MELPESLPARLYLLAYDKRRRRLTARTQLGYALRAAALADLELRGNLADEGGKVRVADDRPVGDPVLDAVLQEIAGSRPRGWGHWVRAGQRAIKRAVQDQLDAGRWIRVAPRRVLGLFPAATITLRDPRALSRLTLIAARTLHGGRPAERVDRRDAALVALAAAGELPVLPRRQRRAQRHRITRLTERSGSAAPALHKVVQLVKGSAGGG
jgi:Golgi phosphoprotein 3 (GPP34)